MRLTAAAAVLIAAASACAQSGENAIHIQIDRPVLEPGEYARIVLAPSFDTSRDYAMSGILLNLHGPADGQGFSDFGIVPGWSWSVPGVPPGRICEIGICGVLVGQLNFPPAGIYADPTSPIPAFHVTFTAPAVAEPTEVDLETESSRFLVYLERESGESASRLDELVEGRATILVVPCRADFDLDGELNIFDFLAFQNAFVAGDPMADFDFDGELTLFDFLAFQNRFDQGC